MTHNKTTISIMTLNMMTINRLTLNMMTSSIKTLGILDTHHINNYSNYILYHDSQQENN